MTIKKKVKCLKCNTIIEENGTCTCGTVVMVENVIQNAYPGKDYQDISPKLLNE